MILRSGVDVGRRHAIARKSFGKLQNSFHEAPGFEGMVLSRYPSLLANMPGDLEPCLNFQPGPRDVSISPILCVLPSLVEG